MDIRKIERENEKRRDIPTESYFPRQNISTYLDNFDSSSNFLINGNGKQRKSTLLHWIAQVYTDPELSSRPIVILSTDEWLLKQCSQLIRSQRIINNKRRFSVITNGSHRYKPFDGMDRYEIKDTLLLLDGKSVDFKADEWNDTVFNDVCRVLEKYDYDLSLDNLNTVFDNHNEQIEKMLRQEHYTASAESAVKNGFSQIYPTINRIYNEFCEISSYENGRSILGEVKLDRTSHRRMPCTFFCLSDKTRRIFLNYLSKELRIVSGYVSPIIIVDSISLVTGENNDQNLFFDYLLDSSRVSLTLSGVACDSLIPSEHLERFIKKMGFYMCLTKGGTSGGILAGIELGSYDHIIVEESKGKVRETYHLISHDKHNDINTREENRARIRSEDLAALNPDEAYFVHRDIGWKVKGLRFFVNN